MKEMSVSEVIAHRRMILGEFDRFCQESGLRYSLGYGSLLGAVRHKDMIPWDDDIDVLMLREDFDALEEKTLLGKNADRFRFVTHRTNPEIQTKIGYFMDSETITVIAGDRAPYGVHIDIFPVDALPESPKKRRRLERKRRYLHFVIRGAGLHPKVHKGLKRIVAACVKAACSCLCPNRALDRLMALAKREALDLSRTQEAAVLVEMGEIKAFPAAVFKEYCQYPFGERVYWGVKDYDALLHAWYGDYMTPPDEKKQVISIHPLVKFYQK